MKRIEFLKEDLSILPLPNVGYKTIGIDSDGVVKTIDDQGNIEGIGGSGGGNGIYGGDGSLQNGVTTIDFATNFATVLEFSGGQIKTINDDLYNSLVLYRKQPAAGWGTSIDFNLDNTLNVETEYAKITGWNNGDDDGWFSIDRRVDGALKAFFIAKNGYHGIYSAGTAANTNPFAVLELKSNTSGGTNIMTMYSGVGGANLQHWFQDNGTVRMNYSGGNFGIGLTTVPTAKLHVNGTTLLGGDTQIDGSVGFSTVAGVKYDFLIGGTTGFDRFRVRGNTTTELLNVVPQSGGTEGVVIGGAATLNTRLYVNALSGQDGLRVDVNGVDNSFSVRSNGDAWNQGNFAIGKASPTETLDVDGTTLLGGNTTVGGTLTVNSTTAAAGIIQNMVSTSNNVTLHDINIDAGANSGVVGMNITTSNVSGYNSALYLSAAGGDALLSLNGDVGFYGSGDTNAFRFSYTTAGLGLGTTPTAGKRLHVSGETLLGGNTQIDGTFRIDGQTSTGATSGSDTLPGNPVGFITINLDGTNYKVPYYNI